MPHDRLKVKVTLRLTVSQSVCLGAVPHLGHMTSNLFDYFNFEKVTVLSMGAPSLTRGRMIGWLEISEYICIGSRREMEEWTSVPIGSAWDRMKPLGSHTTTERTNSRQEQELIT
jgi:hypothetical protein